MVRILILVSMLFVLACNKGTGSGENGGGSDNGGPVEPGKPVPLAKVVSVSMGSYHACGVDDQNHVACWEHPQKFVPSSPGSSKGSSEVDYPKKTNADLAGQQFTAIASRDKDVCAVRTDGKVLCFSPNDPSKKSINDLSTSGSFTKVTLPLGNVCAIDGSGTLSCHNVDFGSSVPDDITTPSEIIDFALGNFIENNVFRYGVCSISVGNTLSCAALNDHSQDPPAKVEASLLRAGSVTTFSFAALSFDKKVLKFFGINRKIAIATMDTLDLSKTYNDIALPGTAVCVVEASSNEVKCQTEKRKPQSPKKTNDDLKSELVNKVSVGHAMICALRVDKTAFCWQAKGLQPGIPNNIKAE